MVSISYFLEVCDGTYSKFKPREDVILVNFAVPCGVAGLICKMTEQQPTSDFSGLRRPETAARTEPQKPGGWVNNCSSHLLIRLHFGPFAWRREVTSFGVTFTERVYMN
jgi:hypothetical protein